MTPRIALFLAILVMGAAAADIFLNQSAVSLFLGRWILDWLEWFEFWR